MEECVCEQCGEPAKYQCLKDKQYSCSKHCREYHLHHKFQSITLEFSRRQALYKLLQRDIATLTQGQGFDRHFSQKFQHKADAVIRDFREAFEDWIDVHRSQLQGMKAMAESGERSKMMDLLVGRLQKSYGKPLLKFGVEMKTRDGERE